MCELLFEKLALLIRCSIVYTLILNQFPPIIFFNCEVLSYFIVIFLLETLILLYLSSQPRRILFEWLHTKFSIKSYFPLWDLISEFPILTVVILVIRSVFTLLSVDKYALISFIPDEEI